MQAAGEEIAPTVLLSCASYHPWDQPPRQDVPAYLCSSGHCSSEHGQKNGPWCTMPWGPETEAPGQRQSAFPSGVFCSLDGSWT